jgi:signal transduction histidine kinase
LLERNRNVVFEKARADAGLKRAVTNISHDLRTPLTSALGYLQMLEASGLDDDTKTRYMKNVRSRLEFLSALMNDLFEFARVIEGETELAASETNICNVLRDTLSESYPELEKRGFAVDADIPDSPEMRFCNENALRRILQNLIKNAYVHGKGNLSICLSDGAIEIANTAEFPAEFKVDCLFDRFYTADASRTGKCTGLGLAIAKELVERMGGRITADVNEDKLIMRVILRES